MALVEMKYAWLQTQLSQQACAANSEHLLLNQTSFAIAAVEMSGHQTIDLFIFRNVGVKQVQSYAPNVREPRTRANQTASH